MMGKHQHKHTPNIENSQKGLDWLCKQYFKPKKQNQAKNHPSSQRGIDDMELIRKAEQASDGPLFSALMRGDTSYHNNDPSAADLALCNLLAFWTNKDPARMDRLFRTSGLMREKWDEVHYADGRTHGQVTIQTGIDGCGNVYDPQGLARISKPSPRLASSANLKSSNQNKELQNGLAGLAGLAMPHDQIPISPRMSNKLSFPSSLFPQGGGREEAVAAVATESQAPLSLCGNAVLAVMSLAVQGHADIEIPGAGTRPLSLFFLTIGESGERKSTVDSMLSTGIQERERELRKREREARREYDNCQATFDKAKARILNDRKLSQEEQKAEIDNLTDPPPEPLAPLLTVGSDPTFEGIYKLLAAGQPSLGLFSAEGGAFLGGHAMTREHRLRTLTGLSDLWGGSPLYRIRSGDGSSFLLGKRLSFHLAVQPDVASSLLDDPLVKGQGFLSRLLVAHPESTQGTRLYKEPDPANCAMIDAFSAKVLDLLRRSLPLSEDSPTPNELSPRHLPLSVEAKTVWVAFFDEIEAAISTTYADVKGFASKAAEHAARLAGVLTLWDDLDAPSVPLEAMTQGINLARYYLAEHLALTAAKPDPEELIALRIIKWLRDSWKPRHGALISSSDLIQRGPGPVRKAAVAREILSLLVEYGHLAREVAGEVAGKKRKEVYRILEEETPSEF